jgi:5'/3'-nucleotidase SurE
VLSTQVSGTPADCTALALHAWAAIFPLFAATRPVLVVSGINRGRNCGLDVMYSGTVAGAREAAMMGVPAISSSLCDYRAKTLDDYTYVSPACARAPPLTSKRLMPCPTQRTRPIGLCGA